MTFTDWQSAVPAELTPDPIWKMEAYRIGLFVSDLACSDSTKLLKDGRTRSVADQLFRASSRITACITEGYSRASGRIVQDSTSMRWALLGKHAIGTSRDAKCCLKRSPHTESTSTRSLCAYSRV